MIKKFLKNLSLTFLSVLALLSLASVLESHGYKYSSLIVFGDSGLIVRASSKIVNNGTTEMLKALTVGTDGSGVDVTFYTDTATEEFLWDASLNKLLLDGANGANVLEITDGNFNLTDNATIGGTLGVTGVSTFTGGAVYATAQPFIWCDGGAVALATSGTDQAPTDGPRQWVSIFIPRNETLTGIGYLVGSVGGTDSVIVELMDSAGAIVATSVVNGTATLVATTAEFQKIPFSSAYAAVAGIHYISLQMNGTTARLRTYPIPNSGFVANTAAGTFKTAASITPGTTFVASEGPISFVY